VNDLKYKRSNISKEAYIYHCENKTTEEEEQYRNLQRQVYACCIASKTIEEAKQHRSSQRQAYARRYIDDNTKQQQSQNPELQLTDCEVKNEALQ
ncbi:35847_t:CDS:2, partial [Racocetra persica]